MKKRLLLSAAVALTAMSGFALENGDYVYAPQGRFLITGSAGDVTLNLTNLNDFTAVISEGSTSTLASLFNTGVDGDNNGYFQMVVMWYACL